MYFWEARPTREKQQLVSVFYFDPWLQEKVVLPFWKMLSFRKTFSVITPDNQLSSFQGSEMNS